MAFPEDQKTIDLMLGIPVSDDNSEWYEAFKPLLMDKESRELFKMPAQYLFRDLPSTAGIDDRVAWTVEQMDRFDISRALVGFDERSPGALAARERFSERFLFEMTVNPNLGMEEVRRIRRWKQDYGIAAVSFFPAGVNPQCPIDDRRMYPIYAACVEEDLPIFVNVGVPGPRVPGGCQKVELLDEVCWFFPDLKVVMRHGGEPWVDLAIKLMLKYPNLYYSTSAFSPKYYPRAIVEFMNSRGADKVLYAGYFPMGLTLDRIFAELANLPLRAEVWPKFLHDNSCRLFGLGETR